jgi:hypothetical protein
VTPAASISTTTIVVAVHSDGVPSASGRSVGTRYARARTSSIVGAAKVPSLRSGNACGLLAVDLRVVCNDGVQRACPAQAAAGRTARRLRAACSAACGEVGSRDASAHPERRRIGMATVADFIVERLYDWGVRRVYGYPGDGINGFFGALREPAARSNSSRRVTRRWRPSWHRRMQNLQASSAYASRPPAPAPRIW